MTQRDSPHQQSVSERFIVRHRSSFAHLIDDNPFRFNLLRFRQFFLELLVDLFVRGFERSGVWNRQLLAFLILSR